MLLLLHISDSSSQTLSSLIDITIIHKRHKYSQLIKDAIYEKLGKKHTGKFTNASLISRLIMLSAARIKVSLDNIGITAEPLSYCMEARKA